MTKELLGELITKRLFFELTLIIIVNLATSLINFKLGFFILNKKVELKKAIPAIIIMTLYTLCARQFLSYSTYGVITVLLFIVLLTITGKVNIIKASWTALLIIVSTAAGAILIIEPLCFFSQKSAFFFMQTPYGNIVGSLIEDFIPILALFILPKFNLSLIPPFKNKIAQVDTIVVITYGAMFYVLYCASSRLWVNIKHDPRNILSSVIYEWVTVFIIISGHYSIITNLKKQFENNHRKAEEEKKQLTEEKSRLETEKVRLEKEKTKLEEEKIHLEEAKSKLEEEKTELLNQVQKLGSLNKNGESLESQLLRDIVHDFVYRVQNVNDTPKLPVSKKQLYKIPDESGNSGKVKIRPSEMSVLILIGQGNSNKEIATITGLAEGTIRNIVTRLLSILNLADRTQLALYAAKNNLISKNEPAPTREEDTRKGETRKENN